MPTNTRPYRRGKDANWPILKDHEKPKVLDTGLPGAARSTIIPTPGLSEISGVSDDAACGAVGKLIVCSFYGDTNGNAMKTMQLLNKLRDLPRNARIYLEHTGKGYPYYRVKYRRINPSTGRSELVSIYLGRPDAPVLRWMQAIILEDRLLPDSRSFLDTRVPPDVDGEASADRAQEAPLS
jgi:hypothetical protein